MKAYLLLAAITMILGVQFTVLQTYEKLASGSLVSVFRVLGLAAFLSVLVLLPCLGFHVSFAPLTLLYAAIMSVFCSVAFLIGAKISKSGSAALFTFFLMSGGMLVPYVFGLLFWGESGSLMKTLGVLLLLGSVTLTALGGSEGGIGKGLSVKFVLSCLAVFFLNGFAMVAQKSNMTGFGGETLGALDFAFWIYVTMSLFCGGFLLASRLKGKASEEKVHAAPKTSLWKIAGLMLAFAVLSTSAAILQLFTAISVPATFMYPMMLGGTILFTGLFCRLLLGERPSKLALLGMLLAVLAAPLFA